MKIQLLWMTFCIAFYALNSQAQTCKNYIPDDWPNSRYMENGNGTVTDKVTKLIWKQCSEGLSSANCTIGSGSTHTWQQALQLAENTTFAGHSDWRLPNIKELSSLAARNCYNPSINATYFPNTPALLFWSSTPYLNNSNYSFPLSFKHGGDNLRQPSIGLRVRLVRGSGAP